MREWLVLIAIGAGTYVMRVAFLISDRATPPAVVQRALPHIGPAVVGAMVAPSLVLPGGAASVQGTLPAVIAAAACGLTWWRSGSTLLSLAVGLATAWATGAALAP